MARITESTRFNVDHISRYARIARKALEHRCNVLPMALSLSLFCSPFAHVGATDFKSTTRPDHTIVYCYEALRAKLDDISRYCGGAMIKLRMGGEIKDFIPLANRPELLSVLRKNLARYEIKKINDAETINADDMRRIIKDALRGELVFENVTYCFADLEYSLNDASPYCGYVSSIINLSKYYTQMDYTKPLSRADILRFSKEVLSSR